MKEYIVDLIYHPSSTDEMIATDKKIRDAADKQPSHTGSGTGEWSDLGRDMTFTYDKKEDADQAEQRIRALQIPDLNIGVGEQERHFYVRITKEQYDRILGMCDDTMELNRGARKNMTAPDEQKDYNDSLLDDKELQDLKDQLTEQYEEQL